MLFTVLLAGHIVLAVLLIGIILLQQGKGATAGAAFGSGASSTVFGARGSASFLTRLTAVLAILFFSNSLVLAYLYGQLTAPTSLLDQVTQMPPGVEQAGTPAPQTPADVPAATVEVDELPQMPPNVPATPADVPAPAAAEPPAAPAE